MEIVVDLDVDNFLDTHNFLFFILNYYYFILYLDLR